MNRKLWQYIKHALRSLTLTILCGILASVGTIAQMVFLSKIVSAIFLSHQSLYQVRLLLLYMLITIAVRSALLWYREVMAQQASMVAKSELRQRVFMHLLKLGPTYCKGERTGELVATASDGIERLDAYVSRYIPQMILSILIPLLIAGVILPLDWISAFLLLLTGPIIPLLMVLVGSYTEKHTQRQWVALSRMSAHFLDAVQGLTTLKLFGRSQAEQARIAQVSDNYREKTMKVLRMAFLSGAVLEFMTAMAIGLVAVTLGVRLLNNGISFESAFLILLLTPEFYRPLQDLGIHRHAGMEGNAAAKRIIDILETPALAHVNTSPSKFPVGDLTIELSGVSYTYPGNEYPSLRDITFTLPVRASTALVGRSGAGKSTLVNALLRFIEVDSGKITVNGIPISELPVEAWRSSIALVPQHPYLFYGSVGENIRLARPTASDQAVAEAAELAGAATFIDQLPQGYDTQVGEQGVCLSAGQVQRLAIARAFLKNAPFLILDEPTSSLDPESEVLISGALERLMQDRTVLVIAHRYNTIAHADQVVVLQDGEVVEAGHPAELSSSNGVYAQLMRMPSKDLIRTAPDGSEVTLPAPQAGCPVCGTGILRGATTV
jgi:ATP-binding cassette subfamily C protein CydD